MKLRYVELEPSRLFNWLGPENVTAFGHVKQWRPTWWEVETVELRNQFAKLWTEEFDKITQHFSTLEASIRKVGLQRPVSTISGCPRDQFLRKPSKELLQFFPPQYHTCPDTLVYTQPFGGSRVTIARRLGIRVPCVVHDFSNLFPNAPEVTRGNFRQWFGTDYSFSSATPYVRLSRHSHIPKGRYNSINNATREAQRTAAARAKAQMGLA